MRFLKSEGDQPTLLNRLAKVAQNLPGGRVAVEFARKFYGNGNGDDQWQRIVLNRELKSLIASQHPENLDVLEISGDTWAQRANFRTYKSVHYPEYDICCQRLDEQFDLIIVEQVFEHLLWPYRAGKNVHAMLRPGGHLLISTPFMIPVHECPVDCTRWTPTGMQYFLAECGFPLEQIQTQAWGNLQCLKGNLKRWQIYQGWRHSLVNQARYPIQVWALARK